MGVGFAAGVCAVVGLAGRGCTGIEMGIGIAGIMLAALGADWTGVGLTGTGAAVAVVTSGLVSFTGEGGAAGRWGIGCTCCGCCCGTA